MDQQFYINNRKKFYKKMMPESALILFAGQEIRKTNDEFYPFFANRDFLYLTGIEQKESILLAVKGMDGIVKECLYILPSDFLAERWTGRRLTKVEAEKLSGISDIATVDQFKEDFHKLVGNLYSPLVTGYVENIYLDLYQASTQDFALLSHRFLKYLQKHYPYLIIKNANQILRSLRLIKEPCEIEAFRKAEEITKDGILAMMHASRPGMYEYQYKAEYDHAIGQYGPQGPGFPSIISAGQNNFCIHYYSYTGQAKDGDMILNDVGAQWDNHIVDVSRGWPCNGRYTDRQKLLFNCALETSNHMFSIVKPGMRMDFIDAEIRRYNAELLKEAGVLDDVKNIGKYMWHGGAHHIGYDVHDVVMTPEKIAENMLFCIDVGIYHEEWGIGFRLEDNLLVTEDACENLSAKIPRTVDSIEDEIIIGK